MDDDLRELQDPTAWDYDGAELVPPAEHVGAVVAVRFAADEFERIARAAAEARMTLASFVRAAALEKAASQPVR